MSLPFLQDVDPGTRMELPLWLAEDLSAAGDVAIELPVGYSLKSREELRATARTVRLRDKSPAFYTNGLKLSKLCRSEEAQKLSEDVHHVMADRVKYVVCRRHLCAFRSYPCVHAVMSYPLRKTAPWSTPQPSQTACQI